MIRETGFADFHGHYILSIVSIGVNTIVNFPNFNFRFCYEWIITVVETVNAELAASGLTHASSAVRGERC